MPNLTPGYAANIMVRSFLTRVGNHYLSEQSPDDCFYANALNRHGIKLKKLPGFDVKGKTGGAIWEYIEKCVFDGECAYCGAKKPLQVEHLVMINKDQTGLHHPGNVVPACEECNQRPPETKTPKIKESPTKYLSWESQLKMRSKKNDLDKRKKRIEKHIRNARYPCLRSCDRERLKKSATKLYEKVKNADPAQAANDYLNS